MNIQKNRRLQAAHCAVFARRPGGLVAALASVLVSMLALPSAAFGMNLDQRVSFDIPAQELSSALIQFSKQARLQVVLSDEVAGQSTQGISGQHSIRQALSLLLEPAGLRYRVAGETTISIARFDKAATEGAATATLAAVVQDEKTQSAGGYASENSATLAAVQEIIVTGSHIRGARSSSPTITITQDQMRLSGHNNLSDVIHTLPQNFNGGQNPGIAPGAPGGFSNLNITGASAPNLRGLGADATLTLLNGARLPYDGVSQATDVSFIPLAAIDRMEVLLDGASAIYGSDAVGGVVNVLLKRDYDGAELSARYGAATDGGYTQKQYAAVLGTTWESGGFLTALDYSDSQAIRARHRDYLRQLPVQQVTVYPALTSKSGLISGHQRIGRSLELQLDAFHSERRQNALSQSSAASVGTNRALTTAWGISPTLHFRLPGEWSLRLRGFSGRDEADRPSETFSIATGAQTGTNPFAYHNKAEEGGAAADGPLFSLPGGEARISLGAGVRRNTLATFDIRTGSGGTAGSRRSRHGFSEVNLPLISQAQGIPLVTRLLITGAVRHEDYGNVDFADVTTPKAGLIWSLTPDFDLKASWGKSFKAPTLLQQNQPSFLVLYPAASVGQLGGPASATALVLSGGNPGVGPERAGIVTAGFALRPQFLPGVQLEMSYFDLDYRDRVVEPVNVFSQALRDPAVAQFVTLNPTTAQQNAAFALAGLPVGSLTFDVTGAGYNSQNVVAIYDSRLTNAATQKVRGVDLSVSYARPLFGGELTARSNGVWTDGHRRLNALSPEFATAGVVFAPARLRGQLGLTWSRNGLTVASQVNHIGGVDNTNLSPNPKGDSIQTFDLVIDYRAAMGLLGEMGLNVAVTNLADARPPFMQPTQPYFVNYDSTNYSAVGRVVSATIAKRF